MTPNAKAKIISESLPYIKKFFGKTIVIKYGGNAMIDSQLKQSFAKDVVLLKLVGMHPVIVHGGGPQIDMSLKKLGKKRNFKGGMRVTDSETMSVVDKVLNEINNEIVGLIKANGGKAESINKKYPNDLIKVKKLLVYDDSKPKKIVDLGQVGEIKSINPVFVKNCIKNELIPVISSIGVGERDKKKYNVNADVVAGKLATAIKAEKLILLTNTKGVLDNEKKLITGLKSKEIEKLIKNGSIAGGMLPKINSALYAAHNSVSSVHIVDGRVEHALLLEILTDEGVGTLIKVK